MILKSVQIYFSLYPSELVLQVLQDVGAIKKGRSVNR